VSRTELEEDLRATFERAAASVPFAPDVVSRASAGARRHQRRTWAASGAAAAAVATIATVIAVQSGSPAPAPPADRPAPASPISSPSTPPPVLMLPGTWRPVQLPGFTTPKRARPEDPVLTFTPDGTWSGSDGCNSLGGTFTLNRRGEFRSKARPQRLAECGNVPHTGVLAAARRIKADQETLQFFAADGSRLATYARTR
jgi:META domain